MTTLKEKSEQLSLKVFKCPHCGLILGATTPNLLYIGALKHDLPISPTCSGCDKRIRWRPEKENFTKNS
jgi:hypothetical protein